MEPTWTQLRAILVQLIGHLVPTWLNLEPTWTQLGPNLVLNRWDMRMLRSGCADDADEGRGWRWALFRIFLLTIAPRSFRIDSGSLLSRSWIECGSILGLILRFLGLILGILRLMRKCSKPGCHPRKCTLR